MKMAWTACEIEELHEMLQANYNINTIGKILKRSRGAVVQAAKKIIMQQLFYHDPVQVAANYNMSVSELRNKVADPKFYVPLKGDLIPKSFYIFMLVLFTAGVSRFGMVLSQNWNK